MKIEPLPIEGSYLIKPNVLSDSRGWFTRTFCKNELLGAGLDFDAVQMNQSFNLERGTLRGLHYQRPPYSEQKIVRCIAGSVCDVLVDLRKGSPTFLKPLMLTLSAVNRDMVFVPRGVAHGFLTLEENTSLIYVHSEYYKPDAEAGIRFTDPIIGLTLPFKPTVVSDRDVSYPNLDANFTGLEF